ncbi:hypothetical protein, partial [Salmonella enterica]|uniref:hypothetical protein n=1 Tax=Salmonella enterica TaxID=28901 RepID=UPI003F1C0D9E
FSLELLRFLFWESPSDHTFRCVLWYESMVAGYQGNYLSLVPPCGTSVLSRFRLCRYDEAFRSTRMLLPILVGGYLCLSGGLTHTEKA